MTLDRVTRPTICNWGRRRLSCRADLKVNQPCAVSTCRRGGCKLTAVLGAV